MFGSVIGVGTSYWYLILVYLSKKSLILQAVLICSIPEVVHFEVSYILDFDSQGVDFLEEKW